MFTTCTVPELAAFVAAPFCAAGLPHAASSPLAPLTAASVPAERVMKARRVDRVPPMSPVCTTIVCLLPSIRCWLWCCRSPRRAKG